VCLEFLRKLVRDEISLMLDGSAFHSRKSIFVALPASVETSDISY